MLHKHLHRPWTWFIAKHLSTVVKYHRAGLMTTQVGQASFKGQIDRFQCLTVRSGEDKCSREELSLKLPNALRQWVDQGVRGVWFYVQKEDSEWIPVLVQNGFDFHHAKPEHVALLKWLPETEPNPIPPYAHHMIGVGGMVINSKDEILVVQEKFGFAQWKLPGGNVDPNEGLVDAVIREVFEETGIKTEFKSVIAFRHAHNYNFGCSDIYVIFHLVPLDEGSEISRCQHEIAACQWMPLKEYATNDNVNNMNRHFANKFMASREKGVFIDKEDMVLKIKQLIRDQQVYSLNTDE